MAKRMVGLDIGSSTIRAVEVSGVGTGRPTVTNVREIALPDGAVRSGEVIEPHTVAAVLKQLWATGGFRTKDVVIGIGNPKVLVREITVPKLSRSEIRASLPFHVQDLLPVPVIDALLDFYPVSEAESESGPTVSGLLVAAVKESVAANVSAVQLAGLFPVAVDLIPFALVRVLADATSSETTALIDLGAKTTNVVLVSGGVPQFVRIIPSGGADLTAALANQLEIPAEDAERMKRTFGLASRPFPAEYSTAIEALHELSAELLNSVRNTLNYYVNTRSDVRISRIRITGGGARLIGFADALAEITRMEVVIDDPFATVRSGKALADHPVGDRSSLSVAFGLALGSAA